MLARAIRTPPARITPSRAAEQRASHGPLGIQVLDQRDAVLAAPDEQRAERRREHAVAQPAPREVAEPSDEALAGVRVVGDRGAQPAHHAFDGTIAPEV